MNTKPGDDNSIFRGPIAGLLAWIVPGLGHAFLGDMRRSIILFVVITGTFWAGIYIGSVQGTVAPASRKLWFVAQLASGGNALTAYALHRAVDPESAKLPQLSPQQNWVAAEVGVHYTGVAGLLNLLVVLDAIARADRREEDGVAIERGGEATA